MGDHIARACELLEQVQDLMDMEDNENDGNMFDHEIGALDAPSSGDVAAPASALWAPAANQRSRDSLQLDEFVSDNEDEQEFNDSDRPYLDDYDNGNGHDALLAKVAVPALSLLSVEDLYKHGLTPAVCPSKKQVAEVIAVAEAEEHDERQIKQLMQSLNGDSLVEQNGDDEQDDDDAESGFLRVKISDSEFWDLQEQVWEAGNDDVDNVTVMIAAQTLQDDPIGSGYEPEEEEEEEGANKKQLKLRSGNATNDNNKKAGKQFENFQLNIIHEVGCTGFEATKELQVYRGMVLASRYSVLNVVGEAAFSTALRCVDLSKHKDATMGTAVTAFADDSDKVCIKVIKNNKDFFDQSLDEIRLLTLLAAKGDVDEHRVVRLLDFFYHKEHLFLVTELLGSNLYSALKEDLSRCNEDKMFSMDNIRRVAAQVLGALSYISSIGIIHCDLKPENILLVPGCSSKRIEVKLIDFGSSCFVTDRLSSYIQSRFYRAPEVVLGNRYNDRIDVWSLGACLAELATGKVLFHCKTSPVLLAKMVATCGPLPRNMVQDSKLAKTWFIGDTICEKSEDGYDLIYPTRSALSKKLALDEQDPFVRFCGYLLTLEPKERPTADQALEHPWIKNF